MGERISLMTNFVSLSLTLKAFNDFVGLNAQVPLSLVFQKLHRTTAVSLYLPLCLVPVCFSLLESRISLPFL